METATWERLASGDECPFDSPRPDSTDHWDKVCTLSASTLYLSTNQTYRGQCLLILDIRHATRPGDLTADEWAAFCADLRRAEQAIGLVVNPNHVNVAALGNLVPHLHWHIIPRYRTDPRWGSPIWPSTLADMPETKLSVDEKQQLIGAIRQALGNE